MPVVDRHFAEVERSNAQFEVELSEGQLNGRRLRLWLGAGRAGCFGLCAWLASLGLGQRVRVRLACEQVVIRSRIERVGDELYPARHGIRSGQIYFARQGQLVFRPFRRRKCELDLIEQE